MLQSVLTPFTKEISHVHMYLIYVENLRHKYLEQICWRFNLAGCGKSLVYLSPHLPFHAPSVSVLLVTSGLNPSAENMRPPP